MNLLEIQHKICYNIGNCMEFKWFNYDVRSPYEKINLLPYGAVLSVHVCIRLSDNK